jgi:hypothetical protein
MLYIAFVSVLPPFDPDGLLPAGDYDLTFEELRGSRLVTGTGVASERWDATWRASLVANLEIVTRELWQVGISEVFADGSFVEEKDHPNDIDGHFVCALADLASGELTRQLNLLDPYKIWTWDPRSRQAFRGYPKKQLPMWHRYRVELYPHVAGFSSGIRDARGHELEFPSAFRQSRRDGKARGIIKLQKGVAS